jgi:hypothetical protein
MLANPNPAPFFCNPQNLLVALCMLAAKARKVNGIPVLKMKPKGRVPKMAQPRGMPISVGKNRP